MQPSPPAVIEEIEGASLCFMMSKENQKIFNFVLFTINWN